MEECYTELWRAVIRQQFADMANQNRKEDSEILRSQARHWLLHDWRDFSLVCEMAGVNPERVRLYAQQIS